MENKFLPIGSVCSVKNATDKIMIAGYCGIHYNGNLHLKDYVAVKYPEGLLTPDVVYFDHEDIIRVEFMGFDDGSYKNLNNMLNKKDLSNWSKEVAEVKSIPMVESTKKYEFDKNGYVIKVNESIDDNPFQKPIETEKTQPSEWSIFKKIEFDENGVVVGAEYNTEDQSSEPNGLVFDENGIIVADNRVKDKLPEQDLNGIIFDENGIVVADNRQAKKQEPQDGGLVFDENGIVIADNRVKEAKEEKPLY